jgi:hypothetical protein
MRTEGRPDGKTARQRKIMTLIMEDTIIQKGKPPVLGGRD